MVGKKYYKQYVQNVINAMPTTITFQKEHRVEDGYGGFKTTIEEKTYIVAIYNKSGRNLTLKTSGEVYVGVGTTKLLAMSDIDLKEGQLIIVGGKEYVIIFINDYLGICKQIEIEVVKNDS